LPRKIPANAQTLPLTLSLTPRQQARHKRILDTTREQLSKLGYDGINMRDLAAAAEVSPTTLYNLYENKDVLILSALQDQLRRMGQETGTTPEDGFEYLLQSNRAITRQILDTPQWAAAITRLMFQAKPEDPITKMLITHAAAARRTALGVMLHAGELLDDTDLESLSNSLTAASWSTIMLWTKDVIALNDLPRDYLRNLFYPLLAAASPKLKRRLRAEIEQQPCAQMNFESRR
jgi:AcrR family transcriptional regulator